jgi:preprotein translocase subunit SecE
MARSQGVPRRVGSEAARRAFSFRMVGEVVSELRRVTWPTREETLRLTIMVIAVSAVIGAFLGAVDLVFVRLFELILGT